MAGSQEQDMRTPNQMRLDDMLDNQEQIIVELQKMNKNLTDYCSTIGQVLLKLTEKKVTKVKV